MADWHGAFNDIFIQKEKILLCQCRVPPAFIKPLFSLPGSEERHLINTKEVWSLWSWPRGRLQSFWAHCMLWPNTDFISSHIYSHTCYLTSCLSREEPLEPCAWWCLWDFRTVTLDSIPLPEIYGIHSLFGKKGFFSGVVVKWYWKLGSGKSNSCLQHKLSK